MNWDVISLRLKTNAKTIIRLAGILLVLLGAYNMFISPFTSPLYAEYRQLGVITVNNGRNAFYLGDPVVMAIGAVIAWFA